MRHPYSNLTSPKVAAIARTVELGPPLGTQRFKQRSCVRLRQFCRTSELSDFKPSFRFAKIRLSSHPFQIFLSYLQCSKNKEGETLPGMIETTYTRQWMQLLKDYVQNGDSIPAFLASVTLELFSQTTEVRDMSVAQRAKQM